MFFLASHREAKVFIALTFLFFLVNISALCQLHKSTKSVDDISAKQAFELLKKNKALQVLDVRTIDEIKNNGKVNATNFTHIDWHSKDFKRNVSQLDKEKPTLVYCASGIRSKKATMVLLKMGFSKLYNLKGGYNSWKTL